MILTFLCCLCCCLCCALWCCINAILCCIESVCIFYAIGLLLLPGTFMVIIGLICPITSLSLLLSILMLTPLFVIIFTILIILSFLFPVLWIVTCFYIVYIMATPLIYAIPLCIWAMICISVCFFPISIPCYLCLCCCLLVGLPVWLLIVCCIFCVLLTCFLVGLPVWLLIVCLWSPIVCCIFCVFTIWFTISCCLILTPIIAWLPVVMFLYGTQYLPMLSIPAILIVIPVLRRLYEFMMPYIIKLMQDPSMIEHIKIKDVISLLVRLFELIMPSIMPFIMRLYNLLMQNPFISQLASALYPMLGSLSSMLSGLFDQLGLSNTKNKKKYSGFNNSEKTAVKDIINLYPASFDGVVR